jgi:O-antigen ligase
VRAGGRARRLALGAGAAGLALLAVAFAAAPRGGATNRGGLLERLGSSLSARSALLLSSHRPMFWGAAFDMLAAEPLSGVGLAGFPFEFPAVHERRSGAPPPATDNATNLLLDVAAECGLPALLLALGAAVPLLRRAGEAALGAGLGDPLGRAAGASLAGFAVASLTGSHLRFAEVALAVAAAAALLPVPRAESAGEPAFRPRRLLPVLAGSGALAALLVAAGTARPEAAFRFGRWAGVHDHARPRRWTSAEAFRRVAPGERSLVLALADERPDELPVSVRVRVDDADAGTIRLEPGDPRRFRVALAPGARVVRLSVSPTFVPRLLGSGPDRRELGVRIHSDGGTAP